MLRLVKPITVEDLASYLEAVGSSTNEVCWGVADAFFSAEDEDGDRAPYFTREEAIHATVRLAADALKEALPSS